jgi:hypothetical protein
MITDSVKGGGVFAWGSMRGAGRGDV